MELTQVKHEIETLAEKHRDEFETVSAYIFAHPELAYHETLAQDQLCGLLEKHGLKYSGEPALWRPHLWQNTGAESRE